mmetsp:Transcript_39348/g.121700  ORF Transcript_39348/g.121700 Transcript_39348/m.121700 type:complete len:422 (-) Transcript_39348:195-1460(-)
MPADRREHGCRRQAAGDRPFAVHRRDDVRRDPDAVRGPDRVPHDAELRPEPRGAVGVSGVAAGPPRGAHRIHLRLRTDGERRQGALRPATVAHQRRRRRRGDPRRRAADCVPPRRRRAARDGRDRPHLCSVPDHHRRHLRRRLPRRVRRVPHARDSAAQRRVDRGDGALRLRPREARVPVSRDPRLARGPRGAERGGRDVDRPDRRLHRHRRRRPRLRRLPRDAGERVLLRRGAHAAARGAARAVVDGAYHHGGGRHHGHRLLRPDAVVDAGAQRTRVLPRGGGALRHLHRPHVARADDDGPARPVQLVAAAARRERRRAAPRGERSRAHGVALRCELGRRRRAEQLLRHARRRRGRGGGRPLPGGGDAAVVAAADVRPRRRRAADASGGSAAVDGAVGEQRRRAQPLHGPARAQRHLPAT